MIRQTNALLMLLVALGLGMPDSAEANLAASRSGNGSGGHVTGTEPKMVERTVCVPQMVTEKRTVKCVKYVTEERERTVTVYKRVPETKQVTKTYTVMVPELRKKTVMQTVMRPVMQEAEQKYMVCVPQQVTHKGVHHVCHMKPVKVNAILRKDEGHWEQQPCPPPAGCHSCCAPKTHCVWVPNIVDKPIQVTVMRPEVVEQPYEYTCTVLRPEMRTRKVKVCNYVCEQHPCEVQYTVCVPQQRTKTCNVTTYKCVPVEKVQKYQVCVPHTVEKQVEVRVCKMVEKTIKVPVCGCCY